MGTCPNCRKPGFVMPLHGEMGGPEMCLQCGLDWHAKHSRRRKFGRIVVKAMKLYSANGGRYDDFDKLKLSAFGFDVLQLGGDSIGAKVGDITSELLADILQLTHPDHHPPERQDLAKRVTQDLLALKPFVFPAPKPKPAKPITPKPRDASANVPQDKVKEALRPPPYPCGLCADTVPYYYCKPCLAEYEKRKRKERDRENEKQRRRYARRQQRRRRFRKPTLCATGCGQSVEAKREDARYCSAACRQRGHRHRVTDRTSSHERQFFIRDDARAAP